MNNPLDMLQMFAALFFTALAIGEIAVICKDHDFPVRLFSAVIFGIYGTAAVAIGRLAFT